MKRNDLQPSRREALRSLTLLGAVPALLVACGKQDKPLVCTDTAGLTPDDAKAREALGYVDQTPDASRPCINCTFYVPGDPDKCGSCKVVKGPVHPHGYCKTWAKKA